ncbi:MAG TPA: hypothetical protein VFH03_15350 [Actinoplanes sp.]|nr:hypothetical protein [Actinoplanes sp.]
MSQPPSPPYPPGPSPDRPGFGAPPGYPPIPQQPSGYTPPASGGTYPGGTYTGSTYSGGTYTGSTYSGGGYPGGDNSGGGYPPPPPQYHAGPQYAPPPPAPPSPGPKSPALKIVLTVVAVIAVLCVGGLGLTALVARDKVAQVLDASKITVVEPATLGGRAKVTDPGLQAGVAQLDSELGKVPGATGSVGAAYGDPQDRDLVMVAAASTLSGSPEDRFADFTSGMSQGGMAVQNLTDTDPGPLGGIAKCGDSTSSGVPMAICVWSDNGSIGMFVMMFKDKADLEKEFITLRGEVERKN